MRFVNWRRISITNVRNNFSKTMRIVHERGELKIYRKGKPAFVLFDIEKMGVGFYEEYEKIRMEYLSQKLMDEYHEAYSKLE